MLTCLAGGAFIGQYLGCLKRLPARLGWSGEIRRHNETKDPAG